MKNFTTYLSMLMLVISMLVFKSHNRAAPVYEQTATLAGTVRNCPANDVLPGVNVYVDTATVVANTTTTNNFYVNSLPGILTGIVTDCANGNPVVGAYITWGTYSTWSVAGGVYSMNIYAAGTNTVTATKDGFIVFSQPGITVTVPAPPVTTFNICLNEITLPPSVPFSANLNMGQNAVIMSWNLPVGDYDLIYDDGIQDNFGIYVSGNSANMNAVRFTPLAYPLIIKGVFLDIGVASNYPTGANPFTPVAMAVYNEVGGLPGAQLAAPTTITPSAYGWTRANFNSPVTITSGNFYIVMIQLGTDMASPGIAIDTTVYQMRSYSRMGILPWLPAPGNYMIRAYVNGSGGPLLMTSGEPRTITASPVPGMIYEYTPSTVTGVEGSPKVYPEGPAGGPDNLLGYQIWRLLQGQESTPALWTSVGNTTGLTMVDNSWLSLPCDPYEWAAEAQYTFNRWSAATFSNALGKCWTCTVTVHVYLSNDSATVAGTVMTFTNLGSMIPDTIYTHVMDASGTWVKTNFWKGSYSLTVQKFDYQTYTQGPISIMGDMTFNVTLLQLKAAPTNIVVHDTDALVHYGPLVNWNPAVFSISLLNEPFTSSFATNGWVADPGSNWAWNAADGNPGGCAEFYFYPILSNYSQSLTSKTLVGANSPFLKLQYDYYLLNYGTTTLEQMAVEVWNGTTWNKVANYDNSGGSIPWTTAHLDITSVAPQSGFKIRFRANGINSDYIDWWDIDNVKIIEATAPHDPCIIGYEVYLNNIIDGFTPDTSYVIPVSHVSYGTSYTVCAATIYGSGYSAQDCTTWTDHFLCPPDTVAATELDCSVLVTWHKPNCGGCNLKTYRYDDNTAGDGYSALNYLLGNYFPIGSYVSGVIQSVDMYFSSNASTSAQTLTAYIYKSDQTTILGSATFVNNGAAWPAGTWDNAVFNNIAYTGPFYVMVQYGSSSFANFFDVDNTSTFPGFPLGLGYVDENGVWSNVAPTFDYYPIATFMERVNVCENNKDKATPVTTIYPQQSPVAPHSNSTRLAGGIRDRSNAVSDPPKGYYNTPETPTAAPAIMGYAIYRNGANIAYMPYPDTTQYYDYNLAPGTYKYTVSAKYSTGVAAPWGPAFLSRKAAPPATVTVACGYPLPFFEPWDNDSWSYQQWTFSPNQSNWSLDTQVGDPVPSADFSWQPVITNYSSSLVTPNINASAWTCADIYCDFDLKLVDFHETGSEKMDIDLNIGGTWSNKAEYSDSGSFNWTLKHVNISAAMGKAFQVRFRANGVNSGNILHWYVDNIHIYGVCRPPRGLAGSAQSWPTNQVITSLTWHPPICPNSCGLKSYIYDDGTAGDGYTSYYYMGNYFPISSGAGGVIKSLDMAFSSNASTTTQSIIAYFYKPDQTTIFGQSPAFMNTGATWPALTWDNVVISDLPYTGPFYVMLAMPTSSFANYFDVDITTTYPGYSQGLGYVIESGVWSLVAPTFGYDPIATFMERVNVCENGAQDKDAPITTIDPTQLPKFSSRRHLGNALNLSSVPANPNAQAKPPRPHISPDSPIGSQLIGYDIWRTDTVGYDFRMIHHNNQGDTIYQYTMTNSFYQDAWKYFVTALYQDSLNPGITLCESSSDTILVILIEGINKLTDNITVYPNPADDFVNIVSSNEIRTIEVLDYVGQVIYRNNAVDLKVTQLNVASFNAGVYFVKITTSNGIKTYKLTVTH